MNAPHLKLDERYEANKIICRTLWHNYILLTIVANVEERVTSINNEQHLEKIKRKKKNLQKRNRKRVKTSFHENFKNFAKC